MLEGICVEVEGTSVEVVNTAVVDGVDDSEGGTCVDLRVSASNKTQIIDIVQMKFKT